MQQETRAYVTTLCRHNRLHWAYCEECEVYSSNKSLKHRNIKHVRKQMEKKDEGCTQNQVKIHYCFALIQTKHKSYNQPRILLQVMVSHVPMMRLSSMVAAPLSEEAIRITDFQNRKGYVIPGPHANLHHGMAAALQLMGLSTTTSNDPLDLLWKATNNGFMFDKSQEDLRKRCLVARNNVSSPNDNAILFAITFLEWVIAVQRFPPPHHFQSPFYQCYTQAGAAAQNQYKKVITTNGVPQCWDQESMEDNGYALQSHIETSCMLMAIDFLEVHKEEEVVFNVSKFLRTALVHRVNGGLIRSNLQQLGYRIYRGQSDIKPPVQLVTAIFGIRQDDPNAHTTVKQRIASMFPHIGVSSEEGTTHVSKDTHTSGAQRS